MVFNVNRFPDKTLVVLCLHKKSGQIPSIKYYFMGYYKCNTLFLVIELSEAVVRAASTMWVEVEVVLHVTYALG